MIFLRKRKKEYFETKQIIHVVEEKL